jgi:hypothetical protein
VAGGAGVHADAAARLEAAHRALRADPDVQFTLDPVETPKSPEWLLKFLRPIGRVIGRFFRWLDSFLPDAPWAKMILWMVIALAAAALALVLWKRLRGGAWRWPFRRGAAADAAAADEEEWVPEEAPARAWLKEADAFAAEGRYADAVHHLLLRSVDDIALRRPRLVRPALTSRELALADTLPVAARDLFSRIAALVERSFFGGRPVESDDWAAARQAYADFILPRAWKA